MASVRRRDLLQGLALGALTAGLSNVYGADASRPTSGLSLGDLSFGIEQANLEASLADPYLARLNKLAPDQLPLLWALTVKARSRTIGGIVWAPSLVADYLKPPARRWVELEGYSRSWDTSAPQDDDPAGTIHVVTHESIPKSSLKIVSRVGFHFLVLWRGTCDLFVDATYRDKVPYRFSGLVRFTRIQVDASERDTAASLRLRLSQHIALDGLRQNALRIAADRYDDGTRKASATFVPVD